MADDLRDRGVRLLRHADRPWAWLDGGGDRSWVAEMSPGASRLRRVRPEGDVGEGADWRPWGGKRTAGVSIDGVAVAGGDRVLSVAMAWRSRLGEERATCLLLEFAGRQSNGVVVAAEDGTIVDALRPVSGKVNRFRELLPNRVYIPPPTFDRVAYDTPWPWDSAGEDGLGAFITRTLLGMSPSWANEIVTRSGQDVDIAAVALTAEARENVERTARAIVDAAAPHIVVRDEVADHLGFAPASPGAGEARRVERASAAVEEVSVQRARVDDRTRRERELQAYVKRRREQLARRTEHLRRDLARTDRADGLKKTADLIMAHIGVIPPRSSSVVLTDWYSAEQADTTVELNPDVDPSEQARRMYLRSRKLRESIPHIRRRLQAAESELATLNAAAAEPTQELLEGIARNRAMEKPREGRSDQRGEIRPRRYRTREGGWLVLVGRNDRENDTLSLKLAAPDDLWFHAQGCPGSHVVLRREGRQENPSKRAIGEAAGVAAYWSKARGAQKVGVSYTEAKYVRKTKGASPGTVSIRHEKLITVPPALLPLEDETRDAGEGSAA